MSNSSETIREWVPGYGPVIDISHSGLETLLESGFGRTDIPRHGGVYLSDPNLTLCSCTMTVAEFHERDGSRLPGNGEHDTDRIEWRTSLQIYDDANAYPQTRSIILSADTSKAIASAIEGRVDWQNPQPKTNKNKKSRGVWHGSSRCANILTGSIGDNKSELKFRLVSTRKSAHLSQQ
jgi:hypothetical protein